MSIETAPLDKAANALGSSDDDGMTPVERLQTEPEQPKPDSKESKISTYTVFVADRNDAIGKDDSPDDVIALAAWRCVGMYEVEGNGGQREARRQAIEHTPEVKQRLEKGEAVWFFCVGARQFKPHAVYTEKQAPRLVV